MDHRFSLLILVCLVWNSPALADEQLPPGQGRLRVATCQFPVSADLADNGRWIRKQMREAAAKHADVAHFPECALSGYPGSDQESLDDFDWRLLRSETESILALAKELRLWVLLGSTHRLTGKHKPHNCIYVINPQGKIIDRYDKRFGTGRDLKHYSPGDHFTTFEINGVKCGILICYDVRFPELYREYRKLGVQMIFQSFYNARMKPNAIQFKIMPITARARAATNYFFMSLSNSCATYSWPGHLITPDGLVKARLPLDEPALTVNLVDTTKKYYDASGPFRMDAINGKLNSGELVDDERSKDRTAY